MTAPAPISIVVPMHRPDPALWTACSTALLEFADTCDAEIVLSLEPDADDRAEVACTIDELRRRCNSLVVVRNRQRLGMVGNWNTAVERSTREWVMLIGQDDVIDSRGIARTLDLAGHSPPARFIGHRRVLVQDGETEDWRRPRFRRVVDRDAMLPPASLHLDADLAVYLALRNGNVFGEPCSVIFARSLFDDLGGYSSQYDHAADLDFALRAALRDGHILLHPHAIAERHLHASSLTSANVRDGSVARDRWAVYSRYAPTLHGRLRSRARGAHAVFTLYDAAGELGRRAPGRCLRLTGRALRLAARSPRAAGLRGWEILRGRNEDRALLEQVVAAP